MISPINSAVNIISTVLRCTEEHYFRNSKINRRSSLEAALNVKYRNRISYPHVGICSSYRLLKILVSPTHYFNTDEWINIPHSALDEGETFIIIKDHPYTAICYTLNNCCIQIRNNSIHVFNNTKVSTDYTIDSVFSIELDDFGKEDFFSISLMINDVLDKDILEELVLIYKDFKKEKYNFHINVKHRE